MRIVLIIVICALFVAFCLVLYARRRELRETFKLDIGNAVPKAAGGSDTSTETGFHRRLNGLRIFSGTIIGVLIARLWSMQLVSSDEYSKQAESNRTRTLTTSAPRGRILDRNGVELVANRSCLAVAAEPDVVDDEVEMMLLANLIGMPYYAVRRKIQNQNEGAQNKRTVAVDVSRRVVAFIDEHPYLFNGVAVEERTERLYPNGSLAAHVLGYTGTISQEALEWSEDPRNHEGIKYSAGDIVGQAGIEYQYESVLQGIRGEQVVYVDAYGSVLDSSASIDPQSGSDVVLTIDAKVQRTAEESLARVINQIRASGNKECNAGCAVAMDVTNGEIIALASAPTYNPSVFTGGISYDDWARLSSEDSASPLMNRVVSGLYPSASTIKPLGVLAALDYNIATPETSFYCSGFWTGFGEDAGQYCWDHYGHGGMNLQSGITYSCDIVFYEIGKGFYVADSEGLQETYRNWGLGTETGVDLPSEEPGRVPDAEWKWNYWDTSPDDVRQWQGGDSTNLSIGQGDILVTPLQMCCVYAGLATRGTMWKPHVLKSIRSATGSGTVIEHSPEINRSVTEPKTSYELVERGLKGVIYEESPAQAAHFTNMVETVAGKTGTAERAGREPTGWFIAFVPTDNPKYAVASLVEQGGYGSQSAMYVVRDIMGAIYDEPDTSDAVDETGAR
ncbi:MAG: penicillin-binding protein 2 [Coriobacteriales bacterium]|nr:penicillin-binding protein 2 [Coriobacteriales bacterium]